MVRALFNSLAESFAPAKKSVEYTAFVTLKSASGGAPEAVKLKATSAVQAAERAANEVAARRLKSGTERSWRFVVLVGDERFEVQVATYLKAEAVP